MRKINILLLALLCAGAVWGQKSSDKKIVVRPPDVVEGTLTGMQKRTIQTELRAAIDNITGYVTVEGAGNEKTIDYLTGQQVFENKGLVKDSEKAELGELSGADMVAITEIVSEDGEILAEVRLIYSSGSMAGKTFASEREYMHLLPSSELRAGCQKLVTKLLMKKVQDGFMRLNNEGLMVRKEDSGELITWEVAKDRCEKNTAGGYNDWRLPTQDELAILYRKRNDIGGFASTDSNNNEVWYWSSTAKDGGRGEVRFTDGRSNNNYLYDTVVRHCRCVRDLKD